MSAGRLGRHLLALAGLAVAVGVVYANSLSTGFVFDSRTIILENPRLHAATLENLRLLLLDDYWQPFATDGLYRPLTTLSFLFNYAVLGNADRPFGFHVVNLLLHTGCAGFVYALVWHLARRPWPALVAALLFAVHPIATEAVTNLVGRADLLAAAGVLGGLCCHVYAEDRDEQEAPFWAAGMLLASVVAMFSKESGLVLLGVLLAYDLLVRGRANVRHYAVVAAVLGVYLALRWWVAWTGQPPEDLSVVDNPIVEAGRLAGLATAVKVLGREFWLLVWPMTLSADYSWREIPVVGWPPGLDLLAVLGLSALVALVVVALRFGGAVRGLGFLLVFFALAILPTSNLLVTIGSIMAERFLYLPLAAFAAAMALIVDEAARRSQARAEEGADQRRSDLTVATAVVLLVCGWRTWARNGDWTDDLRLWTGAVAAVPESAKAHKGFADALFAADPRRERIELVIEHAEQAVALRSDYEPALVNLGSYYLAMGDLIAAAEDQDPTRREVAARAWHEKSIAALERARVLDVASTRRWVEKMVARGHPAEKIPDRGDGGLYRNLSLAYVRAGRLEDALDAYEQSRRLDPSNLRHYLDIAAVLARLGRWEEAAVVLFEAVTLAPAEREPPARLVEVYRTFYRDGHAIAPGAGPEHVVINLDDPAVRAHRCRAYEGLVRIFTRAKQPDQASRFRDLAAQNCVRAEPPL